MRPRLRALTPRAYRRLTLVALLAVAFIILTGAAVRLTGSGLGCPDWPQCEQGSLVAPLEMHAMVEFVNRVVTGFVSAAVIVAVLGSLARRPRRRDLVLLSLGLVGGVLGQVVLGGLTVLFHLKPPFVMAHFLLSVVILGNALWLHHRAGEPDGPARPVAGAGVERVARLAFALTWIVLLTGTVVTASGPHGGDEDAERLSWSLPAVTRVHGIAVVALAVAVLVLLAESRRTRAPHAVQARVGAMLAVLALQALVGYVQYFNGVPALLVFFHIAGAITVFSLAVGVLLALRTRAPEVEPGPAPATPEPDPRPVYA